MVSDFVGLIIMICFLSPLSVNIMAEIIVYDKSKKFALRIVRLYKYLCSDKHETVMSKQILRSGTSIGANIAEAECAVSNKDFLSKMYIAFKECAETLYWLELLCQSGYITESEFNSLFMDCNEIKRILSSITKTTRDRVEE